MSLSEKATNELQQLLKEMAKETRENDRQKAEEGFTHRTRIWIHPKAGGDDYYIDIYTNHEPTQKDLEKHLEASAVKDDWKSIRLCPKCGGTKWTPNKTHGTEFCLDCGHVLGEDDE